MPFSENIKSEVKKKAHFKCCICESFDFICIHHIEPEENGGPDTIENAAPLCARCHDAYGANPEKRKWIKGKRDFWYDFCEKKLSGEDMNQLEKTHAVIERIAQDHEKRLKNTEQDLNVLQNTVQTLTLQNKELISSLNTVPADKKSDIFVQLTSTSSTITGSSLAMTQLGRGVYANARCPQCGAMVGLYVSNQQGPPVCSNCKIPMQ